jgi:hypothetical protein
MTQATHKTTKRQDEATRSLLRRFGLRTLALACLAAPGLLAAGCGAGGSPAVANVASTTSTVANVASTTATTATTTHSGSAGGASDVGDSPAGARGGGNHTVINIGNPTEGTTFASCMRKHGVPSFPDPNSQGLIQLGSGLDPHSPGFRVAFSACRKLLPAGFGQPPTQAQLDQLQQQLLAFSTCMRSHAIKGFPDPTGGGLPQIQPVGDLNPDNPHFQTAYNACKPNLPAGLPSKALGGLSPPATGSGG